MDGLSSVEMLMRSLFILKASNEVFLGIMVSGTTFSKLSMVF